MLTPFGKVLRDVRIHRGILLYDMARELGLSSSKLSSIETGKAPIPKKLVDDVMGAYGLMHGEITALREAAASANT